MPPLRSTDNITLEAARIACQASEAHAQKLGIDFNIAVVDTSLYLLHFVRMPNAKLTSVSIAIDKAFTAAGHKVGTHVYKEAVWPGGVAYGLGNTNGSRFTTFAGGLPFKNSRGEVVGGIGASTGTPAQDQEVVQAGVDAFDKFLKDHDNTNRQLKSKL